MENYNVNDKQIWEKVFSAPPVNWRTVPAIPQILDCVSKFRSRGVSTVLDVGCGPGYWALNLCREGFEVNGFDFSEAAISYAQNWAKDERAKADFQCSPVTKNPFVVKNYDAAIATLILDNINEAECEIAVSEIWSALKPSGIFFTLFNPTMTEELLKKIEQSNNPTKGATSVSFGDQEILDLFEDQFTILEFKKFADGTRGVYAQKLKLSLGHTP